METEGGEEEEEGEEEEGKSLGILTDIHKPNPMRVKKCLVPRKMSSRYS